MTFSSISGFAAAALTLAMAVLPASAQTPEAALDRQPEVPDGDLGCVVRLSMVGYSNAKVLKDPKSSEADRKKAEADDIYVNRDIAFYLGRIALRMPTLPLNPTMNEMYEKALSEPSEQLNRETVECDKFQTRTKLDTYKLLQGK